MNQIKLFYNTKSTIGYKYIIISERYKVIIAIYYYSEQSMSLSVFNNNYFDNHFDTSYNNIKLKYTELPETYRNLFKNRIEQCINIKNNKNNLVLKDICVLKRILNDLEND